MGSLRIDSRLALAMGVVVGLLLAGVVVPLGFVADPVVVGAGSAPHAGFDPGSAAFGDEPDSAVGAGGGEAQVPGGGVGASGTTSVTGGKGDNGGGTEVGVTFDSIRVGILTLDPNSAAGFAAGAFADERGVWEAVLADALPDAINGRHIEPIFVKYDAVDNDQKNAACRRLTEDDQVFAVLNTAGFSQTPQLCFSKEHDTPFVWGQGIYEVFLAEAPNRMFSVAPTLARAHRDLVRSLAEQGELDGEVIAVVDHEFPGEFQEAQVVPQTLAELGYTVAHHATLSADLDQAAAQIPVEVAQMRSKGVTLAISTAVGPYNALIDREGDAQLWHPQFWVNDAGLNTTDTGSQAHPASFRGRAFTAWRLHEERTGEPEPATDAACADRFRRNSGQALERGTASYEGVLQTCALADTFLAALQAAGPNLTRDAFGAAWYAFGALDLPFYGGSIAGLSRPDVADRVREVTFVGACTCWQPSGPYRALR